jgi:hypothetical protein
LLLFKGIDAYRSVATALKLNEAELDKVAGDGAPRSFQSTPRRSNMMIHTSPTFADTKDDRAAALARSSDRRLCEAELERVAAAGGKGTTSSNPVED